MRIIITIQKLYEEINKAVKPKRMIVLAPSSKSTLTGQYLYGTWYHGVTMCPEKKLQ